MAATVDIRRSTKVRWRAALVPAEADGMNSSLWRVVATPVRAEVGALTGSGLLSVLRIGADLARPWPLAIAVDVAIDDRPGPSWLPAVPGDLLLVLAGVASVLVTAASAYTDRLADRQGERAAQRIGARLRGRGVRPGGDPLAALALPAAHRRAGVAADQ